jgi:hypothetical protein
VSLTGCKINPIDANFYLQNKLEIFDKNSAADKFDPKKTRSKKYLPSCQLGLKRKNRKQYEYKDIIKCWKLFKAFNCKEKA